MSPSILDCFFCHSIPPVSNPFVASLIALFVANINLSWNVNGAAFDEFEEEEGGELRVEREIEIKRKGLEGFNAGRKKLVGCRRIIVRVVRS